MKADTGLEKELRVDLQATKSELCSMLRVT